MKRLLTAGIFGTILGIVSTSAANASIVSSGFLDEKLTEYALSTALDLKANQSDFTELNTQITNSIDNLKSLWDADIGIPADSFNPNEVNNDIEGAFGLVEGFILHSMESLTRGWTSHVGIGVRFDKYNEYNPGLEGMFNGWTIYNPSGSETMVFKGLENISSQIRTIENTYHTNLSKLLVNGENKINVEAYNYTGPIYPLWKLSEGIDKIGKLPDDITVSEMLTSTWTTNGTTYPGLGLISDYIHRIELAYNTRFPYIFLDGSPSTTIDGVDYTGPVYPLWKLSEGIDKIDSIETKIGELPKRIVTGNSNGFLDMFNITKGQSVSLPENYTLSEFIQNMYYGGYGINAGFGDSPFYGLADVIEHVMYGGIIGNNSFSAELAGKEYKGLIDLTLAIDKIGTLPDGYDSVGAALTAIKGIAEDAKAAALAAIPDPKQEGSSGKFVLTVDIVGDNATYHWEKIDREGETTTTE